MEIIEAIKSDRISLMRTDAWRSLLFIVLGAGSVWLLINEKVNSIVLVTAIALISLVDAWQIDKRYLNKKSFVSKTTARFYPSEIDKQIQKDKSHFRVLNFSVSPFNDATTSYYHNSIGGYHGAKLKRYQELIEGHISQRNEQVLNMLNTKYFIIPDQTGKLGLQKNDRSLGNAWFVEEYKLVKNADEELASLRKFAAAKTAIIDAKFKEPLGNLKIIKDASATINLKEYSPDHLVYEASLSNDQLAIFSEIYYKNKSGWRAYIDGKEVPYLRANYVLRALVIPKGKHKVEFRFVAESYKAGEIISLVFSILMILMIAGGSWLAYKKSINKT